jgi:biopolymer transport protein ExbD
MAKESKATNFVADLEEPEICIAAMADCLFVLLIFFMSICSVDVMRSKTQNVALPEAHDAREIKTGREGWAYLNVLWYPIERRAETWFEDRKFVEPEQLGAVLTKRMSTAGLKSAYIRAQLDTPYAYISKLSQVIAEAGIPNLIFGTYEAETERRRTRP